VPKVTFIIPFAFFISHTAAAGTATARALLLLRIYAEN